MATIKAGTYRFNDELTPPNGNIVDTSLEYVCDTVVPLVGAEYRLSCKGFVLRWAVNDTGNGDYYEQLDMMFHVVESSPDVASIGIILPKSFTIYSYSDRYSYQWYTSQYGEGIKQIIITEDQSVSPEFYAWFTANAVEQKEISGKWKFKDVLTRDLRYGEYVVNFSFIAEKSGYLINCQADRFTIENTTEGTDAFRMHYTIISMNPNLGADLPLMASAYSYEPEISDSGWLNSYGEGIKTIDFGTEPQSVSAEFYNWLTANAVPAMASITHNGSTIAELFPGQTATLKCAGMKMEDDVVVAVGELPETEIPEPVMQTKEVTITENGTIEITPDDGFCGLSKIVLSVNVEGGTSGGNTVEIVSWADGTDEQIAAMVAALDNGTLTIEETGWQIGDERKVTLSAMDAIGVGESHEEQEVTLVLMDSQHYNLTKATVGGSTKDHFVVGLKNALDEKGYMTPSKPGNDSWNGCERRAWCNNIFRSAIPATLRDCFKQFKVVSAASAVSSSVTESDDYFALFAEKEVFDFVTNANQAEGDVLHQIKWYETAENRKKTIDGAEGLWWTRSTDRSTRGMFCCVYSDGTITRSDGKFNFGIAPFGCI